MQKKQYAIWSHAMNALHTQRITDGLVYIFILTCAFELTRHRESVETELNDIRLTAGVLQVNVKQQLCYCSESINTCCADRLLPSEFVTADQSARTCIISTVENTFTITSMSHVFRDDLVVILCLCPFTLKVYLPVYSKWKTNAPDVRNTNHWVILWDDVIKERGQLHSRALYLIPGALCLWTDPFFTPKISIILKWYDM